jgi:hypothetical protein
MTFSPNIAMTVKVVSLLCKYCARGEALFIDLIVLMYIQYWVLTQVRTCIIYIMQHMGTQTNLFCYQALWCLKLYMPTIW